MALVERTLKDCVMMSGPNEVVNQFIHMDELMAPIDISEFTQEQISEFMIENGFLKAEPVNINHEYQPKQ